MNDVMSGKTVKTQKSVKNLPLMNTDRADLKKANAYPSTRIPAKQENCSGSGKENVEVPIKINRVA